MAQTTNRVTRLAMGLMLALVTTVSLAQGYPTSPSA